MCNGELRIKPVPFEPRTAPESERALGDLNPFGSDATLSDWAPWGIVCSTGGIT